MAERAECPKCGLIVASYRTKADPRPRLRKHKRWTGIGSYSSGFDWCGGSNKSIVDGQQKRLVEQ